MSVPLPTSQHCPLLLPLYRDAHVLPPAPERRENLGLSLRWGCPGGGQMTLGPDGLATARIGDVDMSTMPNIIRKLDDKAVGATHPVVHPTGEGIPPLGAILNLHDFEAVAQRAMVASGKKQAWDYYSSGADDELTYNENVNAFQRIWLKPRILVDVHSVDTRTSILGHQFSLPVYLSAVAMCGLGHADGEIGWVRAAARAGALFMVPNLSSKSFEDILAARAKGQVVIMQIYVNPDRSVVLEQIRACEKLGVKALCITVDSAVAGKRERDLRNKIAMALGRGEQQSTAGKGSTRKAGSYANRDPALSWSDIAWFRQQTNIPIVIKGVQCAEDALRSVKAGAAGVILSNHGGRNCDTSRSGIEVLPEVIAALEDEGVRNKIEVWVDGGVRRGTDVLKAIAMGADAVGLGKPAVFSMSAYGEEGIVKMFDILREELEKCMRLVGAPKLADLKPRLVDANSLNRHTVCAPIPPSPYVWSAPPKLVRSPEFPTEPMKREALKEQIQQLQAKLDELDHHKRYQVPSGVKIFGKLVKLIALTVLSTVFATSHSGSLHRSAIFLIVFLVVHMAGNLTSLFGRDMYNSYGHHLNSMPLINFIELYLAMGFVVHVISAGRFTLNKRKAIGKAPLTTGLLALSGSIITVFVVLHLRAFRFSDSSRRWRHTNAPPDSPTDRDLYILMLELFASESQVVFYCATIVAIGFHLHRGWMKTVLKMDITKDERDTVVVIGHAMILPLCAGFASIPLWMYAVQQPALAAVLGRSPETVSSISNATGGQALPHAPFAFLPSLARLGIG
jgi:L-lactate dehydrogenase (cytochrome)|eukprot:COSAG01_NODE_2215_length_8133_cov_7.016880_5_plen_792_part_00